MFGMKKKYLLCPQCGIHVFYVMDDDERFVFYVDRDLKIVPKKDENADFSNLDLEQFHCMGCSWKGPKSKLIKHYKI
jgi:hypothetical protein